MKSIGHPIKMPTDAELRGLTSYTPIAGEILKILHRCGAPKEWGTFEVRLLLNFFISPTSFKFREGETPDIQAEKQDYMLYFATMFAIAPDAMMNALPKIRTKLDRLFDNPATAMEMDAAIEADLNKLAGSKKAPKLFTESAGAIADDAKKKFGLHKVTLKNVEHARKAIRSKLAFPRKKE